MSVKEYFEKKAKEREQEMIDRDIEEASRFLLQEIEPMEIVEIAYRALAAKKDVLDIQGPEEERLIYQKLVEAQLAIYKALKDIRDKEGVEK